MTTQVNDRRPSLGIGPMSRNVVDAVIEQAYELDDRLMLIASRRQIEGAELGGGYVEGWTTEQFADYVHERDPDGRVVLCRDHGGPWQHPRELALALDEEAALASSAASFERDLAAGFELLHIDTSEGPRGEARRPEAIRRLVELYGRCHEMARSSGRTVAFEIGVEGQGVDTDRPTAFGDELDTICELLSAARLPLPTFVVAQTGTKVVAMMNTGSLLFAPHAVLHTVGDLVDICARHGAGLKAHNADYLPPDALRALFDAGIAAANVAPELGVAETLALLGLLEEWGRQDLRDEFLALAYDSGAWGKWFVGREQASDEDKATAAGHYTFGTEAFQDLRDRIRLVADRRGEQLEAHLRAAIGVVVAQLAAARAPVRARALSSSLR